MPKRSPQEYEINSMDRLQEDIKKWTRKTFPKATPLSASAHLVSEAIELHLALGGLPVDVSRILMDVQGKDHGDPKGELADVAILSLDVAHRIDANLYDEVTKKLAINYARTWGAANASGFFEHDKTED